MNDRISSKKNIYSILTIITILTLSLYVVKIPGIYSVSIAFIFCICYSALTLKSPVEFALSNTAKFYIYFLFTAIIWLSHVDLVEFLKSLIQTLLFIYIYNSSSSIKYNLYEHINFEKVVRYSIVLIVIFEALQVFELLVTGNTSTWFLLDSISISTADDIGRFEAVNYLGYFRPISYYHEPSYLGLVLFTLLIINNHVNGRMIINYLAILGIIFTLSSIAIFFLLLYGLMLFIIHYGNLRSLFLFATLLIAALLVGAAFTDHLRIDEIFTPGTSGHERLILPFNVLFSYLPSNPFGIPLGNSSTVLNNSLFLFPLYFGIAGIPLLLLWINFIRNRIRKKEAFYAYLLAFFMICMTNGALFTVESSFLILLLNSIFMKPNLSFIDKQRL